VQEWFSHRFEAPTDAQKLGWPAIARGRHTLIAAPTGSGKTLAAFLVCLDNLVRSSLDGGLPDRTEVVYVSPLKALSNDIQKNLAEPLAEIGALAESRGTPLAEIRVAVRTGDTPAKERQAMARRPPHILITTPESLYILLTSKSGRQGLGGVRTLILDELHAVAGNKRGSHLSLSVERLCALADSDVTRIGLSATQRPIDLMARFLVGCGNIDPNGDPDCTIVDTGHARAVDLELELPKDELGPIATHEIWGQTLDRIAGLVNEHETTLVFVNTRRLVERVAHQMSERLGEESVVPHHGSLSRETRRDAELRLKTGQVKLCVATASLELGIDIGSVDLVCQIGSPRSIGLLLQRVGRSGHSLGGTPKGRLFPLTRDELLECMAVVRGFRRGNLDRLTVPEWPLDVLAQQIVAECASREWDEDAMYELARLAYPYRDLPLKRYEEVIEMLSRGVAPREGRRTAYLHRDAVNRRLRGRRGARLAALTSGGAIPDNADYDVIAEPENTFVGTVNEDFAIESLRGDVFLLGNTPWRIRRVESGRVRVEDAQGASPNIPFWLGEAPGRTTELSDEVSDLRDELFQRLDGDDAVRWLGDEGFSTDAAEQAVAYMAEGVRILGTVPTKSRIVAERFFDESGGMQLVIHSPFGSKINRAWGMALRKQICRTFDFELQAAATDDGINLSLGPSQSFPLADVFRYISSGAVDEVLTQAVLQAPLFGVRWRWDASRALALLRFAGGRKVPAPLQRMRSDDLLAAVFPEQVACQDNAMPGDVEVPDHPLVFETMRDCLTEAIDVAGLKDVLESVERGEIEVFARDTTQPSVFSHQILNAMPYAFLDDAPLEERRSRAVALRRALPEDSRDLGRLDEEAIRSAVADAWPRMRDADELHDALLTLGMLPEEDIGRGVSPPDTGRDYEWFEALVKDGRAVRASYGRDRVAWVASEHVPMVSAAFPDVRFHPMLQGRLGQGEPPSEEEAVLDLVRGRVECTGPFTAEEMADQLGLDRGAVDIALARLEGTGIILRGHFTPGRQEEEACDRRILARIHRGTVAKLRKAVEPVSAATYGRFLFRWQRASGAARRGREGALIEVIEQLQGFESAAGAWESEILPLRTAGYDPTMLDTLCLSGDAVWGRFNGRNSNGDGQMSRVPLSRTIPISLALRESLPWLVDHESDESSTPVGAAGEVLGYLTRNGASFLSDISTGTRRLPSEVETALWQLAAAGKVTSDGFGAVRALVSGSKMRAQRSARSRRRGRNWRPASRWALLQANGSRLQPGELTAKGESLPTRPSTSSGRTGHVGSEHALESRAIQLLQRYGVVFPEVLARDSLAPRWRDLVRVYRRAEARGEIRGGRFVAGFVGEQFALPEAVDALRSVRDSHKNGRLIALSACDPLNLVGVLTPGPRVPAVLGNRVVYRDGLPVASLESGEISLHVDADDSTRSEISALLGLQHTSR
jgi:ATP-dependent Lhr-like helicase